MKNLFMQAVKFVGFSGIGWLLDFFAYTILGLLSSNLVLNNTISSFIGVTFVFVFATRKVFQNNGKIPLAFKYIIYLLYQCVLIFCVSKLLNIINGLIINGVNIDVMKKMSYIISKIIVTPITMALNFFVMKVITEKLG